jgi:hypothetical protein
MKRYFGFAIADSMFAGGNCMIKREEIAVERVRSLVGEAEPCLNPSHKATIDAMKTRFEIDVPIPAAPPQVKLDKGDSIIVMGVRGLPRLIDRHEYTPDEISKAAFTFALYTVS